MKKHTSKSASVTQGASSRSGTSAKTAATASKPPHQAETKAIATHRFSAALELAKKKKTRAEARKSLLDMGIITQAGDLAEQYKAKRKASKTGGRSEKAKTAVKAKAARISGKTEVS